MASANTRPSTPPPQVGSETNKGNGTVTPEHVRIMQENRLRAKARIQQQAAAQNPSARMSALGKRRVGPLPLEISPQQKKVVNLNVPQKETSNRGQMVGPNGNVKEMPNSTRNANLDLESTKVSPLKGKNASMAAAGAIDDPNAPLPRDKSLGNYIEFDLSKLHNSKGGFLVDEDDGRGKDSKTLEEIRAERERQRERLRQSMDPGINLAEKIACSECGSRDVNDEFRAVFDVLVCRSCERKFTEKYSLLTKTEVKEDYLLTDAELKDPELLPHLLKANPHKSTYSNMMLYLRCQVEKYAFSEARWGSEEGLDAEFARREDEKAKRREGKFIKGLRELRKRTRDNVWEKRQAEKHVCSFEDVEDARGKQRCRDCGFEIDVDVY